MKRSLCCFLKIKVSKILLFFKDNVFDEKVYFKKIIDIYSL